MEKVQNSYSSFRESAGKDRDKVLNSVLKKMEASDKSRKSRGDIHNRLYQQGLSKIRQKNEQASQLSRESSQTCLRQGSQNRVSSNYSVHSRVSQGKNSRKSS